MKTNDQQALLYDDNCPLCVAYTKAFVKTGLLQEENRIAFSAVDIGQFRLDSNRARHEIPFINLKTGEVKYGVDALAEILNRKLPFVKPIVNIRWVHWLLKKLYSFISYNRKIIVASPSVAKACFDCSPNYSFRHRLGLAFFTCFCSSYLVLHTAAIWFTAAHSSYSLWWLMAPALLIIRKTKQQAADILVHCGTTMLLSIILLKFFLKIFSWLFTSTLTVVLCSLLITAFVFLHQAKRRSRFYTNEYNAYNAV